MIRILLGVLALAAVAAPAAAQVTFKLHPGADSAVGLVPGSIVAVPVRATNFSSTVTRARLTFHFDPAKLSVLSVIPGSCCSSLFSLVDTARTAGTFTVGASGNLFGTDQLAFSLRVQLSSGVTDGTFLRIELDSLTVSGFTGDQKQRGSTEIAQVCHAAEAYGDVDSSGATDSRDALITLSASIGLPATGFNLALGDVDMDSVSTSRDALFMLSHAVGAFIFQAHRIGLGIPDACPGTGAPAQRLVFVRRGTSADSLYTLAAGSTTALYVPNTADASGEVRAPRLASDGVSIVYECYPAATGSIPRLCRINADGTGLTDIAVPAQFSERPDWSPGDTVIAYISSSFLHRMSPAGAGDARINNTSFPVRGAVAWNRTASLIAYTNLTSGIRTVTPDGVTDAAIPVGGATDAYVVRWNAAGDSLAFNRTGTLGIWALPAGGGIPERLTSIAIPTLEEFDWTAEGLIFRPAQSGVRGLFLLPSGGGPLVRLTTGNDASPASRRNP